MHVNDPLEVERAKYQAIWTLEQYGEFSPGLDSVERFIQVCHPKPGATVIDIGCGQGKAALELKQRGLVVTLLDIVDVRMPEALAMRHITDDVAGRWPSLNAYGWDYGYCCDVLEHVPPEFVLLALTNIIRSCRTSWLSIALLPDQFGAIIGQQLHLTVRPFDWWRDHIALVANWNDKRLVDARDLWERGLYVVQR